MPTYGGVNIFGLSVELSPKAGDHGFSGEGTFGFDGLTGLDPGGRGGWTTATGLLAGIGLAGLMTAEIRFRSYNDSVSRVLSDGVESWPEVVMHEFHPEGPVIDGGNGICYRQYSALFRHLR